MNIKYEIIPSEKIECCRDLCDQLMAFQKSKAKIRPELFDGMNFDSRMLPSVNSALNNFIVIAKDDEKVVGYVYANIAPKVTYSNAFATFFDLSSVPGDDVNFENIDDYFIFVSNGNDDALEFYKRKGFVFSHEILDGFITVLRNLE